MRRSTAEASQSYNTSRVSHFGELSNECLNLDRLFRHAVGKAAVGRPFCLVESEVSGQLLHGLPCHWSSFKPYDFGKPSKLKHLEQLP